MEINEKEAEILKEMYEYSEQENQIELKYETWDKNVLKELKRRNLIECHGNKISLTKHGFKESEKIVRIHRLAEKLIHDSLGVSGNEMEIAAHSLEHIIKGNNEECICTLLNHPKKCPHGKNIPACSCIKEHPCDCSLKIKEILGKSAIPLTQLKEGESGKIVYINSPEIKRFPVDISPGKEVTIIRASASPLFQIDKNKIILNKKIAQEIMVGTSK